MIPVSIIRLGLLAAAAVEWLLSTAGGVLSRGGRLVVRALDGALSPERAAILASGAAGAVLVASQFIDFRAVEIGQAGYLDAAGSASAPLSDRQTPWDVHGPALIILGLLATALVVTRLRTHTARPLVSRLLATAALAVVAIGLLVSFAVDLPEATDAGAAAGAYASAEPVLLNAFFAQVAALCALAAIALLPSAWRNRRQRRTRPRGRAKTATAPAD